jgi:hypothetical protein
MFQLRQPGAGQLIAGMFFVALICSAIYGAVVGSFSMGTQLWAAPVKIAGGLIVSAVICLPSLYIFACLSGSQARLSEICGLVAGLLLLMTILLVGFAPVGWLFSQSTESVVWMGAGVDGSVALGLLVHCQLFCSSLFADRIFPLASALHRRTQRVGNHFHARRRPNDYRLAPDPRYINNLLS